MTLSKTTLSHTMKSMNMPFLVPQQSLEQCKSRMTLRKMTFSKMILGRITLGIMPFSRMTLSITTLSCTIESINLPFLGATSITRTTQRHGDT